VLRRPKAIVFDMGGVFLTAASRWEADTFALSFPEGLPEAAPFDWFLALSQACLTHYTSHPVPRPAVDMGPVIGEHLAARGIEPTAEAVRRWSAILAQWEVRPIYPHVAATLAELNALGIRLGLVSNTVFDGRLHRINFARHGILERLETTVFSAEFGWNKPHPGIFAHALDAMGVDPRDAWYVGDRPDRDVCGAHGAGMTAVLVNSAHVDAMTKAPENRPDLWVTNIASLPGIVARLSAG